MTKDERELFDEKIKGLSQQQIEKFIGTVENLIPKFEEKKLEYSRQGDEFGFNVMKDKIKERLIELNTVRWVLDNSSINEECVSMDAQELKRFESVYQPSKEITFCWLRKQYVQLSTEENHTEIVDRANDSLLVWKAAKLQAVPEGFVVVPKEPTDAMLFAASGRDIVAEHYGDENIM